MGEIFYFVVFFFVFLKELTHTHTRKPIEKKDVKFFFFFNTKPFLFFFVFFFSVWHKKKLT